LIWFVAGVILPFSYLLRRLYSDYTAFLLLLYSGYTAILLLLYSGYTAILLPLYCDYAVVTLPFCCPIITDILIYDSNMLSLPDDTCALGITSPRFHIRKGNTFV